MTLEEYTASTKKEIESNTKNYLTIILNAPRGVTRTAGANAQATKFAISPTITVSEIIKQDRFCRQSEQCQMLKKGLQFVHYNRQSIAPFAMIRPKMKEK